VVLVAVAGVAAAACTGGSSSSVAPAAPAVSILPSADRIRSGQTRLGAPEFCIDDVWCAAGLSRVYGLDLGTGVVAMATPTATVEALDAGAIDLGVIPASASERNDSRIEVLGDDRGLEPLDNVVPVVDGRLVKAAGTPLTTALDRISARLGTSDLWTIEQALASGGRPELAAEGWLQSHPDPGLGSPPAGIPQVVIGARADAESQALADVYGASLLRAGWPATVSVLAGDRADELDALDRGAVNMTVEFTATLSNTLAGFTAAVGTTAEQTLALLRGRLSDRGLVALTPAPAMTGVDVVMSRRVALTLGVGTLSDVARVSRARAPSGPVTPPAVGVPAVTAGTVPAHPVTLGVGSSGPAVTALQDRLTALGYLRVDRVGALDGSFDEATRRAVTAFQADQGVLATGQVDPPTRRALADARPTTHPAVVPATGDPGSVRPPPVAVTGGASVAGPAGTVYLAFAGGPSRFTTEILTVLQARGVTATFFTDADAAGLHPDQVKQIALAGNAVGVTAAPHDGASPIAQDVLFRTLSRAQDSVAAATGHDPVCWLAPYGATDAATRDRGSGLGLKAVLWDVDPQDWRRPDPDTIATDVVDGVHAGSVVLLHDGGGDRSATVNALTSVLDQLSAKGFGFAALPDC